MTISKRLLVLSGALAITVSGAAVAATRTYSTFDPGSVQINSAVAGHGWFSATGTNTNTNGNYITGTSGGIELRSFFIFDLKTLTPAETVTSAKLVILNPANGSAAPAGTLNFWAVTSNHWDVNFNQGLNTPIFTDLGDGANYHTTTYAALPPSNVFLTFTLNGLAISDLQAAAGKFFVVGGTYTGGGNIFGFTSGAFANYLIVETIDPPPFVCDTSNIETQLCEVTDLLLTPESLRCVDGVCGPGTWGPGLVRNPNPPACVSSR